MTVQVQSTVTRVEDARSSISQLVQFALSGLPQMFDTEKQLFCFRVRPTRRGLVREGLSHRYTLITLLGLQRLQAGGGSSFVDHAGVLEGLVKSPGWITNLGDLGLLLWAYAHVKPQALDAVLKQMDVPNVLDRYPEARQGKTMELSWFLTGLSVTVLAKAGNRKVLAELATRTREILMRNQGPHGIFGHQAGGRSIGGALRARIGAFADQVYPIYALSRYAQAFGDRKAVEDALRCGELICKHQGTLGQWWWHYNSQTGDVLGRYPVFSVHQHGMAPMALLALSEVTNRDYSEFIYRGLDWIFGKNELNRDFREQEGKRIWRSIYTVRYRKYWRPVAARLGIPERDSQPADLAILQESRPYESGWLFYALARPARAQGLTPVIN